VNNTLVSRATDLNGTSQPTAADLKRKKTFLEDNGQFPEKSPSPDAAFERCQWGTRRRIASKDGNA